MGWVDLPAHFALLEADKVVSLAIGKVVSLAVGKVARSAPGGVASRPDGSCLDSDSIDRLLERPPNLEYLKSASHRKMAAVLE